MEIEFHDKDLDRLETDVKYDAGYAREIVKTYRKRIQAIRAANDERDLRAVKGNHFEKLKGARSHQHSMRINDQMRLIVEIKQSTPKNIIIVMSVEDYH
jgi:proteic killer suppression protein